VVDQAVRTIAELIEAGCDDDFGFHKLGSLRTSKLLPTGTLATKFGFEFSIDIPQHIVQLLNKEANTERLQDIYLGLAGIGSDNSDSLTHEVFSEITFTTRSKGITIR
jgi:hypothetical protein